MSEGKESVMADGKKECKYASNLVNYQVVMSSSVDGAYTCKPQKTILT